MTWPSSKCRALTVFDLTQLLVSFGISHDNDLVAVTSALNKDGPTEYGPMNLRTPQRQSFPHHKLTATPFSMGDAVSVSFNAENRTVFWRVSGNNHAIEYARETAPGKAFRKALNGVTWNRGTGGRFLSANEYSREADKDEPGRGSQISQHFGPLGDQAYKSAHGAWRGAVDWNTLTLRTLGGTGQIFQGREASWLDSPLFPPGSLF